MAKQYVFLDESGDLGKTGSKYFVVASLVIDDPKRLEAVIIKARRYRMKKKFKKLVEFKANYADSNLRKRILKGIGASGAKVYALVIDKSKMHSELYDAKERFFNFICGLLVRLIAKDVSEIELVIDKRTGNKTLLDDINSYVSSKIRQLNPSIIIVISHLLSHECLPLQAADFVSWAYHRKYEYGDSQYYSLIEKIVQNADKELLWKK